ncbi:hypothetical protein [Streptomyces sp. NRRL WC-3549]|uniref:hypothetical protein n=1 Tax=Streptomyces sp. NRRL WC-3549 TaxID=1463925 RepID=UPI0004C51229|nr:hypothetical protein [Streptomyces sp. NRRL WC-3549]
MTHAAGPPPPGRRRPDLRHWLKPRSSRSLVLGICMAVGGLAGGVRGLTEGRGAGTTLVTFAVGILGVLLVVGYFSDNAKR